MLFSSEKRPDYADSNMRVTEISKALGEAWGKLSDKAKKPYATAAEEDKARFQKELAEYEAAGYEMPKKGSKKSSSKKTKVKRSPSAYNLFMKARYSALSKEAGDGTPLGEISKMVGREWKALSDEDKAEWVKAAEDLKEH